MNSSVLNESQLSPPLHSMNIRWDGLRPSTGGMRSFNSPRFGMTRNGNTRAHQGIDLEAQIGTPVFSIADGVVDETRRSHPQYGLDILLRFKPTAAWLRHLASAGNPDNDGVLFAHYAHLSGSCVVKGERVRRGMLLGTTGVSGNAHSAYPHLHFEVRKVAMPGKGLAGLLNRIDPELIFPVNFLAPVEALSRQRTIATWRGGMGESQG